MTLCKAIDDKRMDLVVPFVLFLREVKDFSHVDINRVFSSPHKWENEFAEWHTEFAEFPVIVS